MTRFNILLWVFLPFLWGAAVAGSRLERGNLLFDNFPLNFAADAAVNPDAYLEGREATPWGFTPQGQLLIATRFGEVDQLHLVAGPAGARRQLTYLDEPITRAAFSPDAARSAFVYLVDAGGDQQAQLYYQRLGEAAPHLLTDGKSYNTAPVWSNAGRAVAFSTTARDGLSVDIDIVEPESKSLPRLGLGGDGGIWNPLDWSPDDGRLLVLKTQASDDRYLYTLDLGSGVRREVEPAATKGSITDARFSRDGQGVYLISNRGSEFAQLRYISLLSGETTLISGHISWDIEEFAISRDGHYLAYVSNEGGTDKLTVLDLRTHQDLNPAKLSAPGIISHLSFDFSSGRLAFGISSSNQPLDAYVLDIAANRLEAWTASEPGPVDLGKFISPRLVHFPTFDRQDGHSRTIPAYVYEPRAPGTSAPLQSAQGPSTTAPHPVLITLPSGPDDQFRPGYIPWIQYLVNELGFVVIAPNLRGTAGYGKSYQMLNRGVLREDAIKDIGALLVWMGGQSTFDAKHVLVSGDFYGGYLALAALVNYSERLQGGVVQAGIANFPSYLSNTTAHTRSLLRAEFGDERDPERRAYLRRMSPLTNAERITRPVLLVQGRNDSQVPLGEAQQLLASLRSKGTEVWYLQANDEGHIFRKKQNRVAYLRAFAQFLTHALKPAPR